MPLSLEKFTAHCLVQDEEIVRLFTDNMVVMHMVSATPSRSPMLMAELHRLHQFLHRTGIHLQMHHLPSALILFADRLSRRRCHTDFLLPMAGDPDSRRVGESEA